MEKKAVFWICLVILAAFAVRTPALQYQGFINPQGYLFYSAIQQTIGNNYSIPASSTMILSNQPYTESPLLVYFPIALWLLLGKSVGIMQLMQYVIPSLFLVLGIVVVYLLAGRLSKNGTVALLSAFIYALSPMSIYHLSFLEYIGDMFPPVFAGIAAYFAIAAADGMREGAKSKKIYANAILAIVFGAVGVSFWSGGYYILACAIAAIFLYLVYKKAGARMAMVVGLFSIVVGFYALGLASSSFMQPKSHSDLGFAINSFGVILPLIFAGIIAFPILERDKSRYASYFAVFGTFVITAALYMQLFRWITLLAIPGAVFAGYGLWVLAGLFKKRRRMGYLVLGNILLASLLLTYPYAYSQFMEPLIFTTPQTFQTLGWISNNTATNATFLASWNSGTLIEALSNRHVYFDAFSPDSELLAYGKFLAGNNPAYLQTLRPNYIYVRYVGARLLTDTGILNLSDYSVFKKTVLFELLSECNAGCKIDNVSFYKVYSNIDGIIYRLNYT
ncbi:MAG: hypothetical protein KGH49_03600 [Candidatus Micrarchaeota archaeon]|nr:hypothetical protein [Candidatus Micrarchaeota archaeon]